MPPRKSADDSVATKSTPKLTRPQRVKDVAYVDALMKYAEVLYKGGFGTKDGNRPERVAAIIEVGRDVGLTDTNSLANIMVVNGRPTIWGDAGMALIRASGLLEDFEDTMVGEPGEDSYGCTVRVKRVGAARDRVVTFTMADARRAKLLDKKDTPWHTYPERMLRWRALGFACRDEFQDVLCGLIFTEEAMDMPAVAAGSASPSTPEPASVAEVPPAFSGPLPAPGEDEPLGPSEGQATILTGLRSLVIASKVGGDDEDGSQSKAAWLSVLEPFGVTSAKDLPRSKIDELIEDLRGKYDPFAKGFHKAT